jgi:hypothetical protein
MKNPEDPVDEVARGRLRAAIVAEDGDEEQLDGVMRMLGAVVPKKEQLPLFGEARGLWVVSCAICGKDHA